MISVTLYLCVSLVPASSYLFSCENSNLIPILNSQGIPKILTQITIYAFPFVMLLPSIPVNFIVASSNLVQNRIMPKPLALFFCYIVPWFAAIPFQTQGLGTMMNYSGILFINIANFIIPFVIYLKTLRFRKAYNTSRC